MVIDPVKIGRSPIQNDSKITSDSRDISEL